MFILDKEAKVKSTGERGIIEAIYPETKTVELCYYDGTYDERRFDDVVMATGS
ncbi:hypothetical protein C7M30_00155 [Bacillus subtilis]|uniref:hypothetical protein n=1 Tax=Bacillus subtilis group TaxID=653685 RepID=UPI00136485EE|nr:MULTISPECIES: hypothetical protein [Bacillus subtilis group]MCY7829837.1 hypothetical protein [Bacillus spizizenii]MCY7943871.1 hypothetical protein [Bacillus inaquosorum]MCY8706738.1 hypothetical protein [Bacillus inaquosorum]MCY9273483.1 hypothetical protein [Bacillus inaquosorum]QHM16536.1 hypothetical protein C7M30_00155 [Bacillus subtilis]